mmetsp:Transcript_30360/g.92853  ORF Transcript_30360/g.92853 Transcript_30360/m.92853 type:complete len:232 (-) Transcript_30360:467-1162(-)
MTPPPPPGCLACLRGSRRCLSPGGSRGGSRRGRGVGGAWTPFGSCGRSARAGSSSLSMAPCCGGDALLQDSWTSSSLKRSSSSFSVDERLELASATAATVFASAVRATWASRRSAKDSSSRGSGPPPSAGYRCTVGRKSTPRWSQRTAPQSTTESVAPASRSFAATDGAKLAIACPSASFSCVFLSPHFVPGTYSTTFSPRSSEGVVSESSSSAASRSASVPMLRTRLWSA